MMMLLLLCIFFYFPFFTCLWKQPLKFQASGQAFPMVIDIQEPPLLGDELLASGVCHWPVHIIVL